MRRLGSNDDELLPALRRLIEQAGGWRTMTDDELARVLIDMKETVNGLLDILNEVNPRGNDVDRKVMDESFEELSTTVNAIVTARDELM